MNNVLAMLNAATIMMKTKTTTHHRFLHFQRAENAGVELFVIGCSERKAAKRRQDLVADLADAIDNRRL